MEKFITEFKASLSFKRKLPQVQEHCQKFLSSFIAVRGSYAAAAIALGEDWIEAIRNELGFDFNIRITPVPSTSIVDSHFNCLFI